MVATSTIPPMEQPPIEPPPPPPMPSAPPPPIPAPLLKQLPPLPILQGLKADAMVTLGPPPLWKMTPPPTLPPLFTTPIPRPSLAPFWATTAPWVQTPLGLAAGTTPSPWLRFTPGGPPAPVPASATALLQHYPASWGPLSYLSRKLQRHLQKPTNCDCPCGNSDSASAVDSAFNNVLRQGL